MSMQPLALIVAHSLNRVIGFQGDMPWHYREDLQHFKKTTLDHAIIMGRLSAESLPKVLPRRRNMLITHQTDYQREGYEIFQDLETAIRAARQTDAMPFMCGGGQIYSMVLPLVTTMYITEIQIETAGDAFFPEYDISEWEETERRESGELIFRCLKRKQ